MSADCLDCAALREQLDAAEAKLETLKRRYGVVIESRKSATEREVIQLLHYFAESLHRRGDHVDEQMLMKDNRETAQIALGQHGIQEMMRFIDWFWLMKPTDQWWRTKAVNKLKGMLAAFNTYRECQRRPTQVTGVDYSR